MNKAYVLFDASSSKIVEAVFDTLDIALCELTEAGLISEDEKVEEVRENNILKGYKIKDRFFIARIERNKLPYDGQVIQTGV